LSSRRADSLTKAQDQEQNQEEDDATSAIPDLSQPAFEYRMSLMP
jgi:hypothetical protein